MPTIFSKIIAGEIPCYKVAENDEFLAFLDISPVVEGHTLVIPKAEVDYIYDLEDDVLARLHVFAKKVAKGVKSSVPCIRVSVAVVGLEVPHAHVHLIPLNKMSEFGFHNPKLSLPVERMEELAKKISQAI